MMSLIEQFQIGIRLGSHAVLIPSLMADVLPAELKVDMYKIKRVLYFVQANDVATGAAASSSSSSFSSPALVCSLRIEFQSRAGSGELPANFLYRDGFWRRVQVAIYALGHCSMPTVHYWCSGVMIRASQWHLALHFVAAENHINLVVQGSSEVDCVAALVLVRRLLDEQLQRSFVPDKQQQQQQQQPIVSAAYSVMCSCGNKFKVDLVLLRGAACECGDPAKQPMPSGLLRSVFGAEPSLAVALALLRESEAQVAMHMQKQPADARPPLCYPHRAYQLQSLERMETRAHPMCEYPGEWHTIAHSGWSMSEFQQQLSPQLVRHMRSVLQPLWLSSFDLSSRSAIELALAYAERAGAASAPPPDPFRDDGVMVMDVDQPNSAPAAAAAAAAAASSASSASYSSSSACANQFASASSEYLRWCAAVRSDHHASKLLKLVQLPSPYGVRAWLCSKHARAVSARQVDPLAQVELSTPFDLPAQWAALKWSRQKELPKGGGPPSADATDYSQVRQHPLSLLDLRSGAFSDVRSVCEHLQRSPFLLLASEGVQYRVSRVVLLRNDESLARISNHHVTTMSRAQRKDGIRVEQWTEPPPSGGRLSEEELKSWKAKQELRQKLESLPSFQRLPHVTGAVQVFHGCSNETLAWQIANDSFWNLKGDSDPGFFGSGIYATSDIGYAATYPTIHTLKNTVLTASGEFVILGAMALLGNVRPIVRCAEYYPDDDSESIFHGDGHGVAMDKGYDTHYVHISTEKSFQAVDTKSCTLPIGQSESKSDEFCFASAAQLHPNLMIFFKPAVPFLLSDDMKRPLQRLLDTRFSQPYTDPSYSPDFHALQCGAGKSVERPNHGMAHTLRVVHLVHACSRLLSYHSASLDLTGGAGAAAVAASAAASSTSAPAAAAGPAGVGAAAASAAASDASPLPEWAVEQAQFCMLFAVVGRENEAGFSDNPKLYEEFKKASKKALLVALRANEAPARLGFQAGSPQTIIQAENFWFDALSCYPLDSDLRVCPGLTLAQSHLLRRSMALAHDLDLLRVQRKKEFEQIKTRWLQRLDPSAPLDKLIEFARTLIQVTGDRLIAAGVDDYKLELFHRCSTSLDDCVAAITNEEKPFQQLHLTV